MTRTLTDAAPGASLTQNWVVRKPAAAGHGGVVVSQSHAASEVGAAVLQAGGSAADAAVAMALTLSSAEPWNSGLGGVAYGVLREADGQVRALDFGPVAPEALTADMFPLSGATSPDIFGWPRVEGDRNVHGPLSFCVPSAVAGYGLLHQRYGRLPWHELLRPAVAQARRGMLRDWFSTVKIAQSAAVLQRYPGSAAIYLPNGLPPVPPEQGPHAYLAQGPHADTLERLRVEGAADFYTGGIAADLLTDLREVGSVMHAQDLARCTPRIDTAGSIDWGGKGRLYHAGAMTAATTLARVVDRMGPAPGGTEPTPDWYARVAVAMQAAYAERLTGASAAGTASDTQLQPGTCTSHLCAMDARGQVVSLTTTLLSLMGSGVVLPRTGVLMNNGVMWFDPSGQSPNRIRGGSRPLSNMLPVLFVGHDGTLLAGGASGGRRILASVYQTLAYVLDFDMPLEAAAHHPRIDVSGPLSAGVDRRLGSAVLQAVAAHGAAVPLEHAAAPLNFACPALARWCGGRFEAISDVMTPWSSAIAVA